MRRTALLLAGSLFATAALAVEPNLRQPDRPDREVLRHVIVQASEALTPEDRAELAAKGVHVQRAITNGRYFARVAQGRAIDDARIASVHMIAPEEKISPTALRQIGKTWAQVNVYFHEDVTIDEARAAILSAGAALDDPFVLGFAPSHRVSVKIAPSQFRALAADDRVRVLGGPLPFKVRTDNAKTAALSHVTELYSAPYGLTGAGVSVSLFELAPAAADHVEFGGRLIVQPSVSGGSNGDKNHATHVAGTIGASGVNAAAKGMAPEVKIFQFCVRAGNNSCKNDWLQDKDQELSKVGSKADNNSWGYILGWESEDYPVWNDGEDFFGAYELELVSPVDEISIERGVLFMHSAGNEADSPSFGQWGEHRHVDNSFVTIKDKLWCYSVNGSGTDCPASVCTGSPTPCEINRHHPQTPYNTVGLVAAAKNVITVGAVRLAGTSIEIANFSSRGPAKDGRVKPDVVARGYEIVSTLPNNSYNPTENPCVRQPCAGTSMATPAVTGMAALLVQQWRRVFTTDPTPAQLKAVIIAGADDLGRPGPDYTFGFGLVNAKTSADLIRDDGGNGARIRTVSVGHGTTQESAIVVPSQQNVRVVLQWADPGIPVTPGNFIADEALVNDLDLKVIGPDGTEHRPWVLDKNQFEKNATRGVNTVDNTEMVDITNAAPGAYRVVVSGTDVQQGPQTAVIVSNARSAAPCIDLTESGNNDASNAYGELVTGQTVQAALCGAGDEDFFRWTALPGQVSVMFTTGDTALAVTLSGGATATAVIPANTTQTVTATVTGANAASVQMVVRASGTAGAEPFYRFTPVFKAETAAKRRSVR